MAGWMRKPPNALALSDVSEASRPDKEARSSKRATETTT